jgi:hypothetical protein
VGGVSISPAGALSPLNALVYMQYVSPPSQCCCLHAVYDPQVASLSPAGPLVTLYRVHALQALANVLAEHYSGMCCMCAAASGVCVCECVWPTDAGASGVCAEH